MWTSGAGLAVLQVLDVRVRAREEQALLARVGPAHDVRRTAVVVTYLDDLRIPLRLPDVVAVDDQTISCLGENGTQLLRSGRGLAVTVIRR